MNSLNRRQFALGAGTFLLGTALVRRAAAQTMDARPPTVDIENIKEIADGVFVIGDHRVWLVPNIGVVLGSESALVIDVGLGPTNGEAVLAAARRIAGPRRRLILTPTHFHPEHGYGAQAFRADATILYNRSQRDELGKKGETYLGLFRQTQGPAAVAALAGTKLVMPHSIYDGEMKEIDLGGRRVELRTYGLAHTAGDQVVYLPKERILFAGDLVEEGMFLIFPYFPPVDAELDGARWAKILYGFQSLNPKLVVPGHGGLGDYRIVKAVADHIETVRAQVRELKAGGLSPQKILAEYKPKLLATYPNWEHPQVADFEIGYDASLPI